MTENEKNLKEMLEQGKLIFEERGLNEELDLYCYFYNEPGPKPQSILFLSLFPDKSGWIALTDDHVTIIPIETGYFRSKLLEEIKIPYFNIASFNCNNGTLIFKDGEKFKMQFADCYKFIYERIIDKFIEKGVSVIR